MERNKMLNRICYLGDDDFSGAAIYLAGIMAHYGLAYDHVASPQPPPESFESLQYALYVVSDYPAARFRASQLLHMAECIRRGSGLLMLGGWESYYGRLGEYHRSALVEVLPVELAEEDDRRNCAQPCLIHKVAEHPILDGLPWETPPGIGGFNWFRPKLETATLLESVRFSVRREGDEYRFTAGERAPLLVLGEHGKGRTAALATDVAPHWVGGFVDWGDRRVVQDIEGGFIDVGNWYAQFFRNLLVWTGRLEATS
ncbi:MAG: hypothetical protein HUU20_22740 [Pirellulales bacterium]|nr:hypothetical protein [Pirellulales bacterium]